MAAHAVSTASLWSIAAVLACDRCDGVQERVGSCGLCWRVWRADRPTAAMASAAVTSARRLASQRQLCTAFAAFFFFRAGAELAL